VDVYPNYLFFSVASDGQHLYVHPINTKCMAKVCIVRFWFVYLFFYSLSFQEYGSLSNSPLEITASLVELEQLTMSEVGKNKS